MPYSLEKSGVRNKLVPRREPYWGAQLKAGHYVGFRKIDATRATWIARFRTEEGAQKYKALGSAHTFESAKVAAVEWFKNLDAGVNTDEVVTVSDACRAYVAALLKGKRSNTSKDARLRFERAVYDSALGAKPLAKLRTSHLRDWRDELPISESSANRMLTSIKAALNFALAHRYVAASVAIEWKQVKPHKNAGKRRELFLDREQRQALIAACSGALRDLVLAATLTGARPGELVRATRSQFDARTGNMSFNGKTGARTVPISTDAVALFSRLATGKANSDLLLTRDDGQPWNPWDWAELIRAAAVAADLPTDTVMYTLRHSFITTALTAGLSTLDVARLVGSSVMMIDKHYGHLVASAARERLTKVLMI